MWSFVVVFLSCVCVCDLFLFLQEDGSTLNPLALTRNLFSSSLFTRSVSPRERGREREREVFTVCVYVSGSASVLGFTRERERDVSCVCMICLGPVCSLLWVNP